MNNNTNNNNIESCDDGTSHDRDNGDNTETPANELKEQDDDEEEKLEDDENGEEFIPLPATTTTKHIMRDLPATTSSSISAIYATAAADGIDEPTTSTTKERGLDDGKPPSTTGMLSANQTMEQLAMDNNNKINNPETVLPTNRRGDPPTSSSSVRTTASVVPTGSSTVDVQDSFVASTVSFGATLGDTNRNENNNEEHVVGTNTTKDITTKELQEQQVMTNDNSENTKYVSSPPNRDPPTSSSITATSMVPTVVVKDTTVGVAPTLPAGEIVDAKNTVQSYSTLAASANVITANNATSTRVPGHVAKLPLDAAPQGDHHDSGKWNIESTMTPTTPPFLSNQDVIPTANAVNNVDTSDGEFVDAWHLDDTEGGGGGGGGGAMGTLLSNASTPPKHDTCTTFIRSRFLWLVLWIFVAVILLGGIIIGAVCASNSCTPSSSSTLAPSTAPPNDPTLELITNLLNETNNGDLTVWENPTSAQYKARDWIVYNDTLRDEILQQGDGRLRQRYTLALLYYATGGDTWSIDQTIESTTSMATTNNSTEIDFLNPHTSECEWTGVTCGELDAEGQPNRRRHRLTESKNNSSEAKVHAFRLDFRGTNLTGSIPPELGIYLPNIKELDLSTNELSGTLSSSLFDKGWKTTLYWLDLSDNQLSGTIPPSLWSLSFLKRLFLNVNRFTGPIRRLEDDPSYNQTNNALTGEGATRQGNFLIQVFINENKLTGSLPAWFTELRDLEEWIAFKNDISGPLPDPPAKLGWWDMSTNRLTGTIPESLWSMPASPNGLQMLYLDNNQLSGPLPPASQPRLKLQKLWLQENALSGTIPSGFGLEWDELEEIKIQGNELTGIFGPIVSNVTYLDEICMDTWPRRFKFEAECLELEEKDVPPVQCDCCTLCTKPSRRAL